MPNTSRSHRKSRKAITDTLKQMAGPDGKPRRLDSKPEQSLATLRRQLDEYKNMVHDPELLASARAEAAWPELDEQFPRPALEEAYKLLDQWSPRAPDATPLEREKFDAYAKGFGEYVRDHAQAKGPVAVSLTRDATERLALADRGARLVEILKNMPKGGRLEQISELVKLDDDAAPARVRSTLRGVARALCDDLLKPEPLDEDVKLISGDPPTEQTVKRKDVMIGFKTGEPLPLERQGKNTEYTIKADQVDSVIVAGDVRDPPAAGVSPLKGTLYSEAIKDFNTQRDKIKRWSDTELTSLRETCLAKKAILEAGGGAGSDGQTLIKRIEGLLEIVRRHPRLFGTNGP